MDLTQAYKILEIPQDSAMLEVKQAYRDLAQIWHPDRHAQNARLQKKALEKMKELNAAYDCICLYLDSLQTTEFTSEKSEHESSTETIIVCPECGTKNRSRSPINTGGARCGKCGGHLFRQDQERQPEAEWEHRTLCGDGSCTGIIDSTGRCTKCGKTYEEGTTAERAELEKRSRQQNERNKRSRRNKAIAYTSVGVGVLLLFLLILSASRSPSDGGVGTQNNTTKAPAERGQFPSKTPYERASVPAPQSSPVLPPEKVEVPIEFEPVNPNRLRTGSAPYTGGIRSGHSEITVDNGTDTDAIVRAVRFMDANQEKIRNFYVRSHDKFVVNRIPPGKYVLRVAFGTDWNSETRKFNYRRSFGETQTFTIDETTWTENREDREVIRTRSSKLSITLHKVPHGNFQSHPINEDEFWQ